MLKTIIKIIVFIVLFGIGTAVIDYTRMTSGTTPLFNISSYNEVKHLQKYRGLFYQASRKVKVNDKESLTDSSDIKFYVFTIPISIKNLFQEEQPDFTIQTKENSNCVEQSKLYYANLDIKVYTYCLDEINVKESNKSRPNTLLSYLEKDDSIIDDILNYLSYTGLHRDQTTQMYKSVDNLFVENGLRVYKCNYENINDIYITPQNKLMQQDFCTYKDDDLKFIFKIEEDDIPETIDKSQKEIFYEDELYYYQFDTPKKDYTYISIPAVRGKQAMRIPLVDVLTQNILTIDDLETKGLKYDKIEKSTYNNG